MRRYFVASALAVGLVFSPAATAQSQDKTLGDLTSTLDSRTPQILEQYGVPGAAVALIREGRVVWTKGFGLADTTDRRPMTADTLLNVGSLSKTVTAWGVMRLVEQGEIGLDQPIDRYITRWQLPETSFDSSAVSIRRLLSHTSGLSNHDFHGWDPATPRPPIEDSLSGKTGTGEVRIVAQPGTAFAYSGANFALLELLVEERSGAAFADFMTAAVLRPLGMSHSGFGLPANAERTLATPYDALGKPVPLLRYNEVSAAGFTTSLRDLAAFAAAGLDSPADPAGRGVLKSSSVHAMQQPQPHSQWAESDPYGPAPQYGLGYTVRPEQFGGHVGVGHGGSNRGWEAIVQIVPDTGDGLVVMTNSSNGSAVISEILCVWWRWGQPAGDPKACPKIEIRAALYGTYKRAGADAAVAEYMRLRSTEPERYDFSSWLLNSMGYDLMRNGDLRGGLQIFRLNADQNPTDANAYDSLAEAYAKLGDREAAVTNYRRSLELNPANGNARNELEKLGVSIER